MTENIYDLKKYPAKRYSYCPESRHYIQMLRLSHILYFLLALSGIIALEVFAFVFTDASLRILPAMIFFVLWCISLRLWLNHLAANRASKCGPQAAHDYNYYLYVKGKPRNRNSALLALARNQIQLRGYRSALDALRLVNPSTLTKENLQLYYLLMAAAYLGQNDRESFEQYREHCLLIPVKTVSEEELQSALTVEALLKCTHPEKTRQRLTKLVQRIFLIATYLMLASLYLSVEWALPAGLEFRRWFTIAGHLLIWLVGLAILFRLLFRFNKWVRRTYVSKARRVLHTIFTVLFCLLITTFALLRGAVGLNSLKGELSHSDGTVTVASKADDGSISYALYEKKGPLLRKYVREQADKSDFGTAGLPNPGGASHGAEPENATTEPDPLPETSGTKIEPRNQQLYEDYLAVWAFLGLDQEYEFQYSAKDYLYLSIAPEQQEDGAMVGWRIVYDRESENGSCSEFVYYRDTYETNEVGILDISSTAILNFYAVVHSDQTVIAADKTTWGGGGTAAYRQATGE